MGKVYIDALLPMYIVSHVIYNYNQSLLVVYIVVGCLTTVALNCPNNTLMEYSTDVSTAISQNLGKKNMYRKVWLYLT